MINDTEELGYDSVGEQDESEEHEGSTINDDVEADVTAALEELAAAESESDSDEGGKGAHEASENESKTEQSTKAESEPKENDEDIKPPASWAASDKEWFNSQPLEAKRAYAKRAGDMERQFHKIMQERAEEKKQIGGLQEVLEPYKQKWQLQGINDTQVIGSLLAAQDMLNNDFVGGMKELARMKGVTLTELAEAAEIGGESYSRTQQNGVNVPPQDNHLQQLYQMVNNINNKLQMQEQTVQQQQADQEVQELYSVRDTTDQLGRYQYPELHDDTFVTQQITPMYLALKQQFPTMSPSDRLKRVYTAVTGKTPQAGQQVQSSNNRNGTRSLKSVRGSTGAVTKPLTNDDVPDSIEETVMQVFRESGYEV